jgi:hypothetical protein
VSFCVICASTNCCSTTLFSFDFSMYSGSTDVALGLVCSLTLQPFLCLHKNSTLDGPNLYILWIIVYANYIFSLYTLLSSHFENDGECNDDLTTNN